MRVLIVDDSRANRMVLQRFMNGFGFETVEAESGLDAIWVLKRTPNVNLITVDYDMPKMTGAQFVRLVREKPELNQVKIVMITSQSSAQKQNEAAAAGVNYYLLKPFDKEKVEGALNELGINTKPQKQESIAPNLTEPELDGEESNSPPSPIQLDSEQD